MRTIILIWLALSASGSAGEPLRPIPLKSEITRVQPMTGIVFWDDSGRNQTDAIQLEFSYIRYSDVVSRKNTYNWAAVEKTLRAISSRGHQAVLRFYFVYPGKPTTVPAYIKALPDYHETDAKSEGRMTGFPDWSHPELKRFVKQFHKRFAARYDTDARLAFVQAGFGLWAEYHIYDGPFKPGQTFPDKAFQKKFLKRLSKVYQETPWSISVDAVDKRVSPIKASKKLRKLSFGVFDDSFLNKKHASENEPNWDAMGRGRYRREPAGGEFSYYTKQDQELALAPDGPHGKSFEKAARAFHISYMIGNDQPKYQPMSRIVEAGMACGYKFRVTLFLANSDTSLVKVSNTGVAPIYRDAFVAVNGVRASGSLMGLAPGKSATFEIASGGKSPTLEIVSDHLVKGQKIAFEADLN